MSILDRDVPVRVRPNLTEAARLIGVSVSTLSRHPGLDVERSGRRDKKLEPTDVLRLAELYKRRSVNEIASELIAYAAERDPSAVAIVEEEIEAYFASRTESVSGKDAFFTDLKRVLPPALFHKVRNMYFASEGREPADIATDLTEEELDEL